MSQPKFEPVKVTVALEKDAYALGERANGRIVVHVLQPVPLTVESLSFAHNELIFALFLNEETSQALVTCGKKVGVLRVTERFERYMFKQQMSFPPGRHAFPISFVVTKECNPSFKYVADNLNWRDPEASLLHVLGASLRVVGFGSSVYGSTQFTAYTAPQLSDPVVENLEYIERFLSFERGRLRMSLTTPQKYVAAGSPCYASFSLDNTGSKTSYKSVVFAVVRRVLMYSHPYIAETADELFTQTFPGVAAGETASYSVNFIAPENANCYKIAFNVQYGLVVRGMINDKDYVEVNTVYFDVVPRPPAQIKINPVPEADTVAPLFSIDA